MMSGFVMASVYGRTLSADWRNHWRDFATMRFARIYPLFILATLTMVLIRVAAPEVPLQGISLSRSSLLLQPVLLQSLGELSWDFPSWSISTEAMAYVFFVFAVKFLLSGKRPWIIGAICVATIASLCIAHEGHLNIATGFSLVLARTLAEFSLGVLLFRAKLTYRNSSGSWIAMAGALCLAIGSFTGWD